MTYEIKGGKWVILYCDCSVDLLYCWLLNHVACAQMTCADWVYLYLGGGKNLMF